MVISKNLLRQIRLALDYIEEAITLETLERVSCYKQVAISCFPIF